MSGETVGVVGLGRMGLPMARHLAAAGFAVTGVDPAEAARARAEAAGIPAFADLGPLSSVRTVLSSLPDTPQARAVYLEPGGLLAMLPAGSLCVDLSTISVEASREMAARAGESGIAFLDAPVSGTALHAEEGTLSVMAGGPPAALERARPFLAPFSSSIHHLGENGSGLEMKLITNRLLTSHLVAIAEAVLELEQAGLDVLGCIEVLRAGAVPRLLDYKAEPLARRDFTPRFTVDLMSKDLRLAGERRPPGPLASVAMRLLEEARAVGRGGEDIGVVIEVLESGEATA